MNMLPFAFASHWTLSVLFQSLFQHRYAAHRMFTMTPRAERALHLSTALVQGSSYLDPRAYAILHREHHAYADTVRDPHSPAHHKHLPRMMLETGRRYGGLLTGNVQAEARFTGGYPQWPVVDRFFSSWTSRLGFGALYTLFYKRFATRRWHWALLPLHFVMGPVHGAIVNWCGHRYGYRNFATRDQSRNTLPLDVVCMGELFQNNHHAQPAKPNFAAKRFEIDPTWQVMRLLARLNLIQAMHAPPSHSEATGEQDQRPPTRREAHGIHMPACPS
ncbi:acyl-CoA desaturase [Myxococcus xanthus]|uniref:acyl-CoA desaturase n=1 Tax=Myxococcus xanthus TaxID=34 RepID=UPI000378FDDE|nr:acyl-CoA desaturase [Myxococcus xanthus]QVW70611.1 acyl-CoA desaturase [Myxococcus xanthus DZ2]UEO03262.1 acyl-CoA desaturase [Myxococcus xanthus DZ2]UYI16578.1 acyl-CoA desaturase [Myxococcus xanthus]UYI23940.1 acyl-CoA desaturase [Myxococcus xanthus]